MRSTEIAGVLCRGRGRRSTLRNQGAGRVGAVGGGQGGERRNSSARTTSIAMGRTGLPGGHHAYAQTCEGDVRSQGNISREMGFRHVREGTPINRQATDRRRPVWQAIARGGEHGGSAPRERFRAVFSRPAGLSRVATRTGTSLDSPLAQAMTAIETLVSDVVEPIADLSAHHDDPALEVVRHWAMICRGRRRRSTPAARRSACAS